jgi:hypothetical protein
VIWEARGRGARSCLVRSLSARMGQMGFATRQFSEKQPRARRPSSRSGPQNSRRAARPLQSPAPKWDRARKILSAQVQMHAPPGSPGQEGALRGEAAEQPSRYVTLAGPPVACQWCTRPPGSPVELVFVRSLRPIGHTCEDVKVGREESAGCRFPRENGSHSEGTWK